MAIGRTFAESYKGLARSLETGLTGLDEITIAGLGQGDDKNAIRGPGTPTPDRILNIAQSMRLGFTDEQIHDACAIDRWFLADPHHRGHGQEIRTWGCRPAQRVSTAQIDGLLG